MKQPYEISILAGKLPQVIINAPSIGARPRAWRTRIQWAWRCRRGKSIDLNPVVLLSGCSIRSEGMNPAIEIKTPSDGSSLFPPIR